MFLHPRSRETSVYWPHCSSKASCASSFVAYRHFLNLRIHTFMSSLSSDTLETFKSSQLLSFIQQQLWFGSYSSAAVHRPQFFFFFHTFQPASRLPPSRPVRRTQFIYGAQKKQNKEGLGWGMTGPQNFSPKKNFFFIIDLIALTSTAKCNTLHAFSSQALKGKKLSSLVSYVRVVNLKALLAGTAKCSSFFYSPPL